MIFQSINDIFSSWNLIPTQDLSIQEQLSCVIRILLTIFIFSLFFHLNTILYIILLFIIIILLYIKENMMAQKENFLYDDTSDFNMGKFTTNSYSKTFEQLGSQLPIYKRAKSDQNGNIIEPVNYNPFAYDTQTLVYNKNYVSKNQNLVGTANPKTFIPPVIVPPPADFSYWKANNLTTVSAINDNKNIDVYQSGYEVSTFCGDNVCAKENNNYNWVKMNSNYKKIEQKNDDLNPLHNNKYNQKYNQYQKTTHAPIKEKFTLEDFAKDYKDNPLENIGQVNKSCGFNIRNPKLYDLPVNLTVGNCEKEQSMKDYNKNLYKQIIQPNVYTTNQVNEPVNSNIGISFDQQFEPLTYDVDEFGTINFTEVNPLDPEFNPKDNMLKYSDNEVTVPITPYNVYDPRFSSYGTSYRAYTDENVGQTRFFYDDVDSVRMPNYVIRSKIDFADFADQYGTMDKNKSNLNNSTIRQLANQKFVDDAITFRTGMQERLMRKHNSTAWQQRKYPIHKK